MVSLDDVATRAGVSKSTASRVLNNRGYLSQKTIMKVQKAVQELNYQLTSWLEISKKNVLERLDY